jgi:hypothetical protein
MIETVAYDDKNNFSARDLHIRVVSNLGPVVIAGAVQTPAREHLRERLQNRSVVVVADDVSSPADLWAALEDARRLFDSGEPHLPRKFVAAILLLRKLIRGDYWGGGAKNKAFAWLDNLAKGRGVDDQFADIIEEVVNDLFSHGLLVKKVSYGGKKYGLNQEAREAIFHAADSLTFTDEALRRLLMKDKRLVSARMLER